MSESAAVLIMVASLAVGCIAGALAGNGMTNDWWHAELIRRDLAHFDAKTARWQFNDVGKESK
jgi:hypothetical protein